MSIQTSNNFQYSVPHDCSLEPLIRRSSTSTPEVKGTKWYFAVFLVVNAALGAGILNFPEAYGRAGGILVTVIVQAVMLVFVMAALLILASCSDLHESSTYQDVVLEINGRRMQQLCAILIALYCYGTCITFLIIIGDQFDRIFFSLHGSDFCHYWYMSRDFTVTVTSILIILPMCFSRRIDFLKYPSSLGVIAIVYLVFVVVYKYYTSSLHPGIIKVSPDKWTDVFNVVPVICFGYQCHISVIPIYSCLEKRSLPNFIKTVTCAIIICVITYTLAGAYGYLTFGSRVPSDILQGYSAKDPIVLIGMVMLAIKIFTTYPILQFCGRLAIEGLMTNFLSQMSIVRGEMKRRIIISILWFASTVAITAFIPNISSVINLLGSLAAVFIFVFPGFCWIKATFTKDPNLLLTKDKLIIFSSCVFIVIGVFLFGVVLTQAIQNDLSFSAKPLILCH